MSSCILKCILSVQQLAGNWHPYPAVDVDALAAGRLDKRSKGWTGMKQQSTLP